MIFSKFLLLNSSDDAGGLAQVACMEFTTWYVDNNGDLYGTGLGNKGQQGSGSTSSVTTFTKRASNVKRVIEGGDANAGFATWFIKDDDTAWGCGINTNGLQGNGNTSNVSTFAQRATNVKDIVCDPFVNGNSTCTYILQKDGTLLYSGKDTYSNISSTTFTQLETDVDKVAAYGGSVWIIKNGVLYGKGYNTKGQQGSGSTSNISVFTQRATDVKDVFPIENATFYLTNNDDLYGCGDNTDGILGNNTSGGQYTFAKIASNVKKVSCSSYTTWYLDNNNNLYCSGKNSSGQQGDGTTTDVRVFTQRATNVKDFASTATTTAYISSDNKLYITGYNGYGQQGSGNTTNVLTFTQRATNAKKVFVSSETIFYITNDNYLYGCGGNSYGQQGSGNTTNVTTFTQRATL